MIIRYRACIALPYLKTYHLNIYLPVKFLCACCVCVHCVCAHCVTAHCLYAHCVYTCCVCEHCVCARSVCAASVRRHFLYFFVYFLEKLKLFIRLKIFIWINQNFNIILKCIICCPSIKHFLLNIVIIIIYLSYNHKVINYHQLNYWFRISLKYTTFLYHHD